MANPPAKPEVQVAKINRSQAIWVAVITGVITAASGYLLADKSKTPAPAVIAGGGNTNATAQDFQKLLQERDPTVFNGLYPQTYRVARVFPNKSALGNGGFGTLLSDTKSTLDIAVISGHTILGLDSPAIEHAIKEHGARVRIVIFDVSPKNQNTCDALAKGTGRNGCDDLRKESKDVEKTLAAMCDNIKGGVGKLEVRVYSKILPYTMWIRDAGDNTSRMVLMRVHMSRERANWPSFLVAKDGGELIPNVSKEFDEIWNAAQPLDLAGK